MIKIFKNPFYIYVFSFLLVFTLYSLGWSNMYPKLSFSLLFFFFVTFFAAILLGLLVDKSKAIQYNNFSFRKNRTPLGFLFVLWLGHSIQFLYFKEVPLLSLINGEQGVDYRDFGIKTFHVILVSFNSFIIVYFFHNYLSTRKKTHLFLYISSLVPPLLILNRGMFLIGIFSSFIIFLMSKNKFLSIKQLIVTCSIILVILYFFGMIGNLRSAHGDPTYIPMQSKATKTFMNSSIPKEYYWTYLYGASPLAGFQNTIDKTEDVNYNLFDMALFEMTPKVVSNRIALLLNREPLNFQKVRDWLTVGTIYAKSYSYAKWLGPLILFLYTMAIILITLYIIPKSSSYHVSVVAILSTIVFMNTFSNMFIFSGMILQLFFPIFFRLFENKKFVVK